MGTRRDPDDTGTLVRKDMRRIDAVHIQAAFHLPFDCQAENPLVSELRKDSKDSGDTEAAADNNRRRRTGWTSIDTMRYEMNRLPELRERPIHVQYQPRRKGRIGKWGVHRRGERKDWIVPVQRLPGSRKSYGRGYTFDVASRGNQKKEATGCRWKLGWVAGGQAILVDSY